MTAPASCRLILESSPHTGSWNMAFDEVLLQSAVERRLCSVRLYRWSEPTLSLGYFQKIEEIEPGSKLAALPKVRRLSGGGAILHHHEWTYSCAVPAGHPLAGSPGEIYDRVHRRVVALLHRYGIDARLRGEAGPDDGGVFLCFGRGSPNDVVLDGCKILGSAQRRRRGAVLQHGSLLLRASPLAPQFPGLLDLAPLSTGFPKKVRSEIGREIAEVFEQPVSEGRVSLDELHYARRLQLSRSRRVVNSPGRRRPEGGLAG